MPAVLIAFTLSVLSIENLLDTIDRAKDSGDWLTFVLSVDLLYEQVEMQSLPLNRTDPHQCRHPDQRVPCVHHNGVTARLRGSEQYVQLRKQRACTTHLRGYRSHSTRGDS